MRCFRACVTRPFTSCTDNRDKHVDEAKQAQAPKQALTQPPVEAHQSASQQQSADRDVPKQLPSPFASTAVPVVLDDHPSQQPAPHSHETSFRNTQDDSGAEQHISAQIQKPVVLTDSPVLQHKVSCPVQHEQAAPPGAWRMPSRGDSAASAALDSALTPVLLQQVSQGRNTEAWQPPQLVSSPVLSSSPILGKASVIHETDEESEMPAACPMSAYYSPSQSAPSISQDDYSSSMSLRSFDQYSSSPDQVKLVQDDQRGNLSQGTSLSRCSISSDQKSHESHGQATPKSDIGSTNPNTTLYNKLGGPDALEAAVDMFYDKVLADDHLKHFFDGTNMMRLVVKQVQFMVYAFGGSAEYKGKDLKAAHFHLVKDQGLNTDHFDMVAGHFKEVLIELGVEETTIDEAMATLGSVRSSFDPKSYIGYTLPVKTRIKASALKDPTAVDTLATLIPASKAEEALVRKAGSKGMVMAAVRVFYMRVMSDEILRPFFEDIDLARLKNKLVSFLAYAFGGGVGHQLNFQPKYKGRDLAFMHSHMIDKGLNMEHFDLVLRHFCQTLRQLNMPQSAIDEAKVNLNKTRAAFQHVIDKAKDPNANPETSIPTDLYYSMHGDKAAMLQEVQSRMATNPEICEGIGLEFADASKETQGQPVGQCPFS